MIRELEDLKDEVMLNRRAIGSLEIVIKELCGEIKKLKDQIIILRGE